MASMSSEKQSPESIEDRFSAIGIYCAAVGRKPSTVSLAALQNSKGYARLQSRIERVRRDLAKYENYMRNNPPKPCSDA